MLGEGDLDGVGSADEEPLVGALAAAAARGGTELESKCFAEVVKL